MQANNLKNELGRKQQALLQLQSRYDDVLERLQQQSEAQVAHYSSAPSQHDAGGWLPQIPVPLVIVAHECGHWHCSCNALASRLHSSRLSSALVINSNQPSWSVWCAQAK
jgi:hypothetical protein